MVVDSISVAEGFDAAAVVVGNPIGPFEFALTTAAFVAPRATVQPLMATIPLFDFLF